MHVQLVEWVVQDVPVYTKSAPRLDRRLVIGSPEHTLHKGRLTDTLRSRQKWEPALPVGGDPMHWGENELQ